MNDRKFESLRKKLDGLGYTQTMHPDSFELVQKLYNYLRETLEKLEEANKEKKKMNSSSSVSVNS